MEDDADSGDHEDVIEAQSKNKFRSFDSIDNAGMPYRLR